MHSRYIRRYAGPILAACATLTFLAGCGNDLRRAKDAGSATKAALSCMTVLDETVARQLAVYLLKRGVKNPGTKSGNFVPDHQPVSALTPDGTPQQLYPHCLSCMRQQGGLVSKILRGQ